MLTLALQHTSDLPIEAECVAPDRLAGLSVAEIERLPVRQGNRTLALADVFAVAGTAADAVIRVVGDCGRVKSLGRGMAGGTLWIDGTAGMHTGAAMTGGRLEVSGRAGDWAGAEMSGGVILVRGSVGDNAGGAYAGSRAGMRGGVLIVGGDAGAECGARMRRGVVAVAGDAGPFAGADLIAGTVLVLGRAGVRGGAGIKRGSLVLFHEPAEMVSTFAPCCDFEPAFVPLLLRSLARHGMTLPTRVPSRFRRYGGDRLALGRGEILVGV